MKRNYCNINNKLQVLKRLESHTCVEGNHWLWTGQTNSKGYGVVKIQRKSWLTHRLSAHLHLGLDLDNSEQFALHQDSLCRHRNCWNPDHLYVGSRHDNCRDRTVRRSLATEFKCGHPKTPKNTYNNHQPSWPGGIEQVCRTCELQRRGRN